MSGPLPIEQGATRYVTSPSIYKLLGRGLPKPARSLPSRARQSFGNAQARIGAVLPAEGFTALELLARNSPWGRALTAAELLALGYFWYDDFMNGLEVPVRIPRPNAPDPAAAGWTLHDPTGWPTWYLTHEFTDLPPDGGFTPELLGVYGDVDWGTSTTNQLACSSKCDWLVGTYVNHDASGIEELTIYQRTGPHNPGAYYLYEAPYGYATRDGATADPYFTDGVRRWRPDLLPALPRPNPNVLRNAPTVRPYRDVVPELVPDIAPARAVEVGPNGARSVPLSPRSPPRRGEREPPKRISASRRFMGLAMAALDNVSELSEIVDAFYDALPLEVRRKVEKARGYHWAKVNGAWRWMPPRVSRQFIDSAGQYGIDGADWKAKALWDHYRSIDTEQALRNVINNQAQDFVYGQLYRNMPANTGHALDDGFKQINKVLENHVYI